MKDLQASLIRTVVPYIVGAIIAFFARHNINLDNLFAEDLTNVLAVLLGSLYYLVVRILEVKLPKNTWVSWLLGSPKLPTYSKE